jgi:hypothetical protein
MVHRAPSSGGTPRQGGVGTTPQSPVYTRSADPEKKSGGEQFGQDLVAGIAEAFGFDGSLLKSPADFGLVKIAGGT